MSERIRLPCFKDTKETLQVVEILAGLRLLSKVVNVMIELVGVQNERRLV